MTASFAIKPYRLIGKWVLTFNSDPDRRDLLPPDGINTYQYLCDFIAGTGDGEFVASHPREIVEAYPVRRAARDLVLVRARVLTGLRWLGDASDPAHAAPPSVHKLSSLVMFQESGSDARVTTADGVSGPTAYFSAWAGRQRLTGPLTALRVLDEFDGTWCDFRGVDGWRRDVQGLFTLKKA